MAADDTGDDLTVGETNHAEDGTELVGNNTADHIFGNEYVFQATAPNDLLGTDAIRGIAEGYGNGVFGSSGQATGYAGVLGRIRSSLGAGVRGENEQGAAVHGLSSPTDATGPIGTGVRGEARDPNNHGLQGVGVEGISSNGIGVRGLSGEPADLATGAIGVLGAADSAGGRGVRGQTNLGTGVQGWATNGVGIDAGSASSVALNAASARDRAGVFQSGDPSSMGTSIGGVAQLQLVPAADSALPTNGHLGDVWAHFSQSVHDNRRKTVSLWLCVNDDPVEWEQIVLSGVRTAGGTSPP